MTVAFNSLFKRFYFSRTQRGGATNQGQGKRSRLEPMARWLQRRMVFMCGYEYDEIMNDLNTVEDDELVEWTNWVRDSGGSVEYCKFLTEEAKQLALKQPGWSEQDTRDLEELEKWEFLEPRQWYEEEEEECDIVHGPVTDAKGQPIVLDAPTEGGILQEQVSSTDGVKSSGKLKEY